MTQPPDAGIRAHAFRLLPGDDLKRELIAHAGRHGLRAAAIVTCVGSLTAATLRFAGRPEATALPGPFEIVALVGTLGGGAAHLHATLADADGRTVGGHLTDGCPVRTTAEVVLVELPGLAFGRELDAATGYRELVVTRRS
jgi:predicted DNA-binding protein with PD1-like motif